MVLRVASVLGSCGDRAAITDVVEGFENRVDLHFAADLRADGRLLLLVVNLHCQHTRCRSNGLFGLRHSRMSRHAFDSDHRAIHIGRKLIARREQIRDRLREEEEDDRDEGHCPQHHAVEGHDPRSGTGGRAVRRRSTRLIADVKGKCQERERHDHEDRSIVLQNGCHPRTGDPAQDQQGRQPASA